MRGRKNTAFRALHLTALSFFAIAWPVLDLLSGNPEFFVVRGSPRLDIVLLAAGLTLVPPLVLLALEALAGLAGGPRAAGVLHLVFVGVLAAAFALLVLGWLGAPSAAGLVVLAAGAGAAIAYHALQPVRSVVTLLSLAVPVSLGLFFLGSPTGQLVLPSADVQPADVEIGRPAPVVMVIFDEFPSTSLLDEGGEIDEARFPAFAELAREATWYRNAVTVSANTSYAVPAILTGRNRGGAALLADHPRNLFTLLGGTYRIEAAEAVTRLCPESLCPSPDPRPFRARMRSLAEDVGIVYLHDLLPEALRSRLPSISGVWGDFSNHAERPGQSALGANFVLRNLLPGSVAGRNVAFGALSRAVGPADTPTLYFLHVLFPHYPWEHTPSGRVYDGLTIPGLTYDQWTGTEFQARQAWQRHIAQVGYTDRLVGELVERLRSTGIWDEALVVLVADHGTSFRAGHDRKVAEAATLEDIAYVPLFVKAPGQRRGETVDETVSVVDVLPTIADHLELEIPWQVEGVSRADATGAGLETIRMSSLDGPLAVPAGELARRRDEQLALQSELFGRTWADLYRFGERPELVGRRLADVPLPAANGASATLDPQDWTATGERVPAFVRGSLSGEDAGQVAVVVNGTVAAVVPAHRGPQGLRFSAFLPESAFRRGPNDVRAVPLSGSSP